MSLNRLRVAILSSSGIRHPIWGAWYFSVGKYYSESDAKKTRPMERKGVGSVPKMSSTLLAKYRRMYREVERVSTNHQCESHFYWLLLWDSTVMSRIREHLGSNPDRNAEADKEWKQSVRCHPLQPKYLFDEVNNGEKQASRVHGLIEEVK